MTFNLILAVDINEGIGIDNKLPWKLSKDLKNFSKLTKGNGNNCVIMGRNTYESIGKILPGRQNIILSNSITKINGAIVCNSVEKALEECITNAYDEVWIIGGSKVYNDFLSIEGLIKNIYLTIVESNFQCDTFFKITSYLHKYSCLSYTRDFETNLKLSFYVYQLKDSYTKYVNNEKVWEGYGLGKFL